MAGTEREGSLQRRPAAVFCAVPHPKKRQGAGGRGRQSRGPPESPGARQGRGRGAAWRRGRRAHPSPEGWRWRGGRVGTRKRRRRRPPDFPGRQAGEQAGGRHAAVLGKAPRGGGAAAISGRAGGGGGAAPRRWGVKSLCAVPARTRVPRAAPGRPGGLSSFFPPPGGAGDGLAPQPSARCCAPVLRCHTAPWL